MDVISLHSYWTVLMFVVFVGICAWAFAPRRRAEFERLARMAVDDEIDGTRGEKADG